MRFSFSVILALFVGWSVGRADVDFTRDVLPVLSENCFHCHGPDEKARKAKLRLDTPAGAARVIVPGKSGESDLFARITSADASEVMPPPDSNRKLTAPQVKAIRQWIDAGAKWGTHWAYVSLPNKVPVPVTRFPVQNALDQFIFARLEKGGLSPSPEATREAWLRRVTFDLTGLPPTPAEIEEFLKDAKPTAYETVVDRLLQSPRYGERMATDWLDLARFADTHGYQSDRARPMWPYRDWVIRAFNRNQPFDRFLTDQLAGDLLPKPTKDQRLATAFNRLHMQNEEGGVVEEEFRVAYVVDRVNTFGTAFLAQTFECCRCHDHKYDPVTQKDYYSLFAFFQNIDESGQTSYFTSAMPVPTLLLSTDEQDQILLKLRADIAAQEAYGAKLRADGQKGFNTWLTHHRTGVAPDVRAGDASFSFDELAQGKVTNAADPKSSGKTHETPKLIPGKVGRAAELDGESGFTFPGVGHFNRADEFTLALWVRPPQKPAPRAVVVHHSKAPIDAGSRGYELLLEDGRVAFGLHHMWPGNSLKVRAKMPLAAGDWTHVAVTYDGSSRAGGLNVYLDGRPVGVEVIRDKLTKDITYGGGEPDLAIGYRFRDNGFKGGAVDEFRVYNRLLTPLEVAGVAGRSDLADAWKTPVEKLTPDQRSGLFEYYFAQESRQAIGYRVGLEKLRQEERKLVEPIPEVMVMQEEPTARPAFLLKRGAYDAPGERVSADTPAALPAFTTGQPRNRLGLARWLTQPDHPLTARVTVNRLWQQMFGTGLVETSDNFGTTGTPPTHPELLDWLARDFITHGWDVKRVLKQMALSATYRQSSRMRSAELVMRNGGQTTAFGAVVGASAFTPHSALSTPNFEDPYNQWLARAPARRLTAEMLRDQALAVSGLLVEKQGGPSVYPYQPDGLWNEAMGRPHYPRSKGDDLYRRSLYTVWKRTAPHPQMTTFDAADRSVCTAKRQSTSTPLQALVLLNDPQFVEAARFLGQRMLKEGGTDTGERVAWAFRLVTGRKPSDKESAVLVRLFDEQRTEFMNDPKAAVKLLAVGDGKTDPKLDPADLAAATQLALAILNLDAAVNRR